MGHTERGREKYCTSEEDVALHVEGFVREEILLDHFSAHKEL